jgi:hypothetical protein
MIELKPYIEMLSSSLQLQEEADARADGRRLKAIMITDAEWAAVADLVELLKPFDDVTNYISGSSYPTMSIIFPTMESLKQAVLNEAPRENPNDNEPTSASDASLGVDLIDDSDMYRGDNIEEDEADDLQNTEPASTEGLVATVRSTMARLFRTHYNVSDMKSVVYSINY